MGWRNCKTRRGWGGVVGERQRNPGQTGASFRSAWRMWLWCALETYQLGCQWSFSEGSVHGVSLTAPLWGCWPQKQLALGRAIQLVVQQSQLLEQRFPQRTALAGEVYLILLTLDKHWIWVSGWRTCFSLNLSCLVLFYRNDTAKGTSSSFLLNAFPDLHPPSPTGRLPTHI